MSDFRKVRSLRQHCERLQRQIKQEKIDFLARRGWNMRRERRLDSRLVSKTIGSTTHIVDIETALSIEDMIDKEGACAHRVS